MWISFSSRFIFLYISVISIQLSVGYIYSVRGRFTCSHILRRLLTLINTRVKVTIFTLPNFGFKCIINLDCVFYIYLHEVCYLLLFTFLLSERWTLRSDMLFVVIWKFTKDVIITYYFSFLYFISHLMCWVKTNKLYCRCTRTSWTGALLWNASVFR